MYTMLFFGLCRAGSRRCRNLTFTTFKAVLRRVSVWCHDRQLLVVKRRNLRHRLIANLVSFDHARNFITKSLLSTGQDLGSSSTMLCIFRVSLQIIIEKFKLLALEISGGLDFYSRGLFVIEFTAIANILMQVHICTSFIAFEAYVGLDIGLQLFN